MGGVKIEQNSVEMNSTYRGSITGYTTETEGYHMKKRVLATLLVSAMVAGMVTGCGVPKSGDSDKGDAGSEGKVFRYSSNTEPTTLDPTKSNCVPDNEIQHAITESLVRNAGGEVKPGVAEEWEVSDDGLVYTFKLNPDAKWSDGEQIKAQDFVYSWQRLMDPETAAPYAFIGEYIKNGAAVETNKMAPSELGVVAKDDTTLEVTLEQPTEYFLSMIGAQAQFAPLRQDVVEEHGKDFASTADKNIYSGPFVLKEAKNQKWIFEPNENYWDRDSVKLDRAELNYIQNTDTALAMYESGELDYVELPSAAVPNYEGKDEIFRNGAVDFYIFNCDEASGSPTANKNFRLALNYAFNRNENNTLVFGGVHQPSNALVFSGIKGTEKTYGEESDLKSFPLDGDEAKAKEYLAAALKDLGKSDPSELSVTITTPDSDASKKQAEACQEMWSKTLGINVEINQITYAEVLKRQGTGEYEIIWGSWAADYDDPYTYLELYKSDCPYNYSKYKNDKVDELLSAAKVETDAAKRMDMLHDAEQIVIDDGAFLPQDERNIHYLLDDDVKDFLFFHCSINHDWVYVDIEK